MKIYKKMVWIIIIIIMLFTIFASSAFAITKEEAEKLPAQELSDKIAELENKKRHQGGTLSENEQADLNIYSQVYNEKVTQTQIDKKEDENADPIENPDAYMPTGNLANDSKKLINIGNVIIGAIQIIGTVISVVALMVIGLKYMIGSAEEKANYKETLVPYLIGAIMVFTIPNLLQVLYSLVSSISF